MATSIMQHLLATVAGLASACAVAPANVLADDIGAPRDVPAELAPWRSSLIDASDPNVSAEWKSSLGATDPDKDAESRPELGAIGLRDVTKSGFRPPDAFDAPKSARKSARNPPGTRRGTREIVR